MLQFVDVELGTAASRAAIREAHSPQHNQHLKIKPSNRGEDGAIAHTISDGCGTHPKDRVAAMEEAKRLGVPTEFNSHGQAKFTSYGHQKRYLKAIGMINKDS